MKWERPQRSYGHTSTSGISGTNFLTATNTTDLTASSDANDYLIYNTTTGTLYFDYDGNGTDYNPVKFAVLSHHANLSASDFVL